MIFYIVYGVIFLALVILSVLAAKHLHWVNAVIVVLLFLSTAAASLGMAGVLHKRSKLVTKLNDIEKKTRQAEKQYNEAVFGKADDIGFGENSLRAKSAELDLLLVGRGRVWNSGKVTAANGQWNFAFSTALPDGSEDQLAQLEEMEVHIFSDQPFNVGTPDQPAAKNIPYGYVGKFRIVESKKEGFLLEDVRVINRVEASKPSSTWTVFEKMPLDRRGSFKQALAAINPNFNFDEMSIGDFRSVLETQFFPAEKFPFEADSVQYEALIDRYAFDGRSIGKIDEWVESQINSGNRKSGKFQPRPEEIQIRYRFNSESKEYTVDAVGSNLDTDGAFTPLGLAVARNLHLNSTVKFKQDEEVVIDLLTATGYERDGTPVEPFSTSEDVTEIDRIYVRENQDFPYLFSQLSNRAIMRNENFQDRKQDNNLYDNTISKNLVQQLQERTRPQSDLEFDNKNLEADSANIAAVTAAKERETTVLAERAERLQREQEILRSRLGRVARVIAMADRTQSSSPVNMGMTNSSTIEPQPAFVDSVMPESFDSVQPMQTIQPMQTMPSARSPEMTVPATPNFEIDPGPGGADAGIDGPFEFIESN